MGLCWLLSRRPALCLLALSVSWVFASPSTGEAPAPVVIATYEGVINPVAAEYVHDALAFAEAKAAQAFILRLDTPGGLDTSMRLIIKDFTSSSIPVVVYVAPSGGRAASAGVFITLAADVAAMASGTNMGAAHPVAMGGGEMDKTMKEKVENDAVAYIKSIAERHGRNAAWAEDAVRKSVSVTEREALKLKIIDMVADDVPGLLDKLDGRKLSMGKRAVTLRTKGVEALEFSLGWRLELLKAISDPNIAFLLMTIGTIGLLAELYNPGAILPGVIGAISLIMAFYSLQTLPINYAGVLLILVGVVLFILEIKVTSYGILTLGGIISMVLGGLLLVKTDAPFMQVSLTFLLPTILTTAALMLGITWLAVKARHRRPVSGVESLVGAVAVAKTDLNPRGQVFVQGELWEALSEQPVQAGQETKVTGIDGLTLRVAPRNT